MQFHLSASVVASLLLAGAGAAQTIPFEGLPHSPVGNAQLQPAPGGLAVTNLGSSGQDGVRIDLGEVQSHVIAFDTASANQIPDGSFLRVTPRGMLNGVPDQVIWGVRVNDVGSQFGVELNASAVQPQKLRVEARLGGVVVDSVMHMQPLQLGQNVAVFQPETCIIDPYWPMVDECWVIFDLQSRGPVELFQGQGPVIADEIVIAAIGGQNAVGMLSETVMQTNFPGLLLMEETIGLFDLQHAAVGQAQFSADAGDLTVSNIGSSGLDGVCIDLGVAETHGLSYAVPPAGQLPDGAFLDLTTFGTLSGVPNQEIWTLRFEDLGSVFGASLDTTIVGSGEVRVDVVSNGQVVDSEIFTPPITIDDIIVIFPPEGCTTDPFTPVGGECIASIDLAGTAQMIQIPGHAPVLGTQVLIASYQQQESVDSLSATEVRGGGGLTTLTILDEALHPIEPLSYCVAKASSSGCLAGVTTSTEDQQPVSGAGGYSVIATGVQGFRPGILFFSTTQAAIIPFQGTGTLCMAPPLVRGPIQFSGGTSPTSCDGSYALVVNNGGPADPGPGGTLFVQAWNRDRQLMDGFDAALSRALRLDFD